jgi:hypothetical protein
VSPLTWLMHTGPDLTSATVQGRPDRRSLTALHTVLADCTARQSGCLLIDLPAMPPAERSMVTGSALSIEAGWGLMLTGTTMLLCPGAAGRACGGTPMCGCLARATEALIADAGRSPVIREDILPVHGAARRSRDIVTEACLGWGLPQAIGVGTTIVTELVNHVIEHASTIMALVVARHRDVVYLAVRSGALTRPTPRKTEPVANLDLMVIHALADHWGVLPDGPDTVTWAAVPSRPAVT